MNEPEFHRQRRMFAIIDNQLVLAEPGTEDSHTDWFMRQCWIDNPHDPRFETIVRGYCDARCVHFYCGRDFHINAEAEQFFFAHLPTLRRLLDLPATLPVCGGAERQPQAGVWPVRREYGVVGDFASGQP